MSNNFEFDQNPQDGTKSMEEGVLDRKKELKGLSSSFSPNIGQPISPPYSPSSASTSKKNDGRSVKSIVAWLESASTNPDTSRHSGDDIKSVHSIGTISSAGSNSSLLSRHTIPGAADVEEYSLTLLKYKQYFTEAPLGRCLDAPIQNNVVMAGDMQTANLSTEVSLLQEPEDCAPGFDICSASDVQLSNYSGSRGVGESVVLDNKESSIMATAGHGSPCDSEKTQFFHRDSEEVLAF